MRNFVRSWLLTDRTVEVVRTDTGAKVKATIPVLKSTRELAREARARIATLRGHVQVVALDGQRFDPDDDLSRQVASEVIRADVHHAWRPAPELGEDPAPELFIAAVEEMSRVTHKQRPHSPASSDINDLRGAMLYAPVPPQMDLTQMRVAAGTPRVPLDDGRTVDHAEALARLFPADSDGLRMVRVCALPFRFATTTGGRAAIKSVGDIRKLERTRLGEIVGAGVRMHIEPVAELWRSLGFVPTARPHAAFRAPTFNPDVLKDGRWRITGRPLEEIHRAAVAELKGSPVQALKNRPSCVELMVLATTPLVYAGVLRSSGGNAIARDAQLATTHAWNLPHGTKTYVPLTVGPDRVMAALAGHETGLAMLKQAVEQFSASFAPGATPGSMTAVLPDSGQDSGEVLTAARLMCVAMPKAVADREAKAKAGTSGGGSKPAPKAPTKTPKEVLDQTLVSLRGHQQSLVKDMGVLAALVGSATAEHDLDNVELVASARDLMGEWPTWTAHRTAEALQIAAAASALHEKLAPNVDEDDTSGENPHGEDGVEVYEELYADGTFDNEDDGVPVEVDGEALNGVEFLDESIGEAASGGSGW